MILIIVLALLLVGARLLGLQVFTVLSGSMEPAYKTGSVIYVRPVEPSEIEIGSPITFVLNESLTVATHRVIDIDASNQRFYTQGDANESPDGAPVNFKNLLGTPVFTIPYLGYVANYIMSPPGMYFAIGGVMILLLLVFLPDLLDEDKKKQHKRKK
jgi:signal peptidase I